MVPYSTWVSLFSSVVQDTVAEEEVMADELIEDTIGGVVSTGGGVGVGTGVGVGVGIGEGEVLN